MTAKSEKISLLVPTATLNKVHAFSVAERMNTSEAMRYIIEAGLEAIANGAAGEVMHRAADPAERNEPTRGKFPRPTGGRDENA